MKRGKCREATKGARSVGKARKITFYSKKRLHFHLFRIELQSLFFSVFLQPLAFRYIKVYYSHCKNADNRLIGRFIG